MSGANVVDQRAYVAAAYLRDRARRTEKVRWLLSSLTDAELHEAAMVANELWLERRQAAL
jgi:hypothetical protein